MKLLLDEQVPRQLTASFPTGFEVRTVSQRGWSGTKNGRLLQLASENGFVALITADKNIEHQQNLSNLPVMLIVLVAYGNRLQDLVPLVPGILDVLEHNSDPGIYRVDA